MAMTLVATLQDRIVKRSGSTQITYYRVVCPCGCLNEFSALLWSCKKLPCKRCKHLIDKRTMEVSAR